MALIPLMFTDLRLRIDETVTVSGASPTGAGVCAAKGLSDAGTEKAQRICKSVPLPGEESLVVVSLCDGIGGLRRSGERAMISFSRYISIEIDKHCRRCDRLRGQRKIIQNTCSKMVM